MGRPRGIKYTPAENCVGSWFFSSSYRIFPQQPITDAEPSLILGLDLNIIFNTSRHPEFHLYFYLFPIFINIIIIQKSAHISVEFLNTPM